MNEKEFQLQKYLLHRRMNSVMLNSKTIKQKKYFQTDTSKKRKAKTLTKPRFQFRTFIAED
jgi:hypothetical protein